MKTREYVFDNAKGFLIFCVVLGHMLEGNLTGVSKQLYILIYSFHMPFFVFLSGYFAKYDAKKMLVKLVMPYLCLQWIACFAETIATGNQMSFTTPVWILWYLYALIIWKMLIPFIATEKMTRRLAIFVCSVAIALAAGFDSSIGYEMGLSRIVVFFPYFLLGYYLKDAERMVPKLYRLYKNLKKEHCLLFLLVIWLIVIFLGERIDYRWLYGSYCYEALSYGPAQRAGMYLIGMGQIAALLKLMSKKETVLCRIGQKSMRIYLCHPVFVLALRSIFTGVPEALVCAVCIVWGLSLDYASLFISVKKLVRIFSLKIIAGYDMIQESKAQPSNPCSK
jgi:fucose 4-O-acetylase-like acetyltransferase